MVRSPFSVRQSHIQAAVVAVASLASTFFPARVIPSCSRTKSPACKRVKAIAARPGEMLSSWPYWSVENQPAVLTSARMAALIGAGRFAQAVTT